MNKTVDLGDRSSKSGGFILVVVGFLDVIFCRPSEQAKYCSVRLRYYVEKCSLPMPN
jgi:hypothetical protein